MRLASMRASARPRPGRSGRATLAPRTAEHRVRSSHSASRERAGGGMNSILETPETTPKADGGGPAKVLAIVGIVLGVVALGVGTYLFRELGEARQQIARLTDQAAS